MVRDASQPSRDLPAGRLATASSPLYADENVLSHLPRLAVVPKDLEPDRIHEPRIAFIQDRQRFVLLSADAYK